MLGAMRTLTWTAVLICTVAGAGSRAQESSPQVPGAAATMNDARLDALIRRIDPSAEGRPGFWRITVREREALSLEEAVRMITYDTSTNWGFHDRGLLREGLTADITIFNPDTVEPRMPEVVHDLPSGSKRLKQYADGMLATVVAGQVVLKENEHTGALPGQLLRGPLARQ